MGAGGYAAAVADWRGLQRPDEHRPPAPARAVLPARARVVATRQGPDHCARSSARRSVRPPWDHRRSCIAPRHRRIPAAPLAHHILDSTHIASQRRSRCASITRRFSSRGLVVSRPRTRRPALRRRGRPAGLLGRASSGSGRSPAGRCRRRTAILKRAGTARGRRSAPHQRVGVLAQSEALGLHRRHASGRTQPSASSARSMPCCSKPPIASGATDRLLRARSDCRWKPRCCCSHSLVHKPHPGGAGRSGDRDHRGRLSRHLRHGVG